MINKLTLQNFRNYSKKEFEFGDKNLILGENGVGKTNILEAIYLLATGKSFRADYESEMVSYDESFFRVIGEVGEIGEVGVEMVENRKRFLVNQIPRRQIDFVGKLKAVLFAPPRSGFNYW